MSYRISYSLFYRFQLIICASVISLLISASLSHAVSKFGTEAIKERPPVPLEFDDIWFYDDEMVKVIPDIDLEWVSVVFTSDALTPGGSADITEDNIILRQIVKTIITNHSEIIDSFYDQNLASDACFLRLRDNIKLNELKNLILELNNDKLVSYAHPTIRIKNGTYAFFNAFALEWKSGIVTEVMERILNQTYVSFDNDEKVYRVNVFQVPFFQTIRLLAEDIHVLKAIPYLVKLRPTIKAALSLPITGGNIGDKIPFELTIAFSDTVSIDPSSIANIDLTPSGIQKELLDIKIDPYDYVEVAEKSPIRITGWLKVYTPGEFTMPSIKIRYTCLACSDNKDRYLETKEPAFKVSSIVPSKQTENKLIIPENYLIPDYKIESYHSTANKNFLISILAFLTALVLVIWFVRQIYAIKTEKKKLQIKGRADILAENIRAFLQEEPPEPHWIYLGEISKLLREFLVEKYRLQNYPAGGTGMIFFKTVKDNLPESLAPSILNLLQKIDDIVAREVDKQPDISSINSLMKDVIAKP